MGEERERVPWARRLGSRFRRRIGEERAERWMRGLEYLKWCGVVAFYAITVVWLGYLAFIVINWSPLWMRTYSACVAMQPESDTVVEMLLQKRACAQFASRVVGESSK